MEFWVAPEEYREEQALRKAAAQASGIPENAIVSLSLQRRSLDARRGQPRFLCKALLYTTHEAIPPAPLPPDYPYVGQAPAVVVVGAGPAGYFAALKLLEHGYKPIVLERGKAVAARKVDVARLNREQTLHPDSNYCFGEGGAGTFSDGKLYTRATKRGDVQAVLRMLVAHGAPPDILVDAHPHIGSDVLPRVMTAIRHTLLSHGGEVHFETKVVDILLKDGRVRGVEDSVGQRYEGRGVILATGHSARDIYSLFARRNWAVEAKGFALGVRVEHPQALINKIQYHGSQNPHLPAASYTLVTQAEGRGVFSFCMCPGGVVVPALTGEGELVLNGMSNSKRNGSLANAGMVVAVNPGDIPDYSTYGALAQLQFQQEVESVMYAVSGASLRAPAQRMTDFVQGKISQSLPKSSYFPGTLAAPLHSLLPAFVARRLQCAFPAFDKKMRGYYTREALLLGVESRTSSPIRILRNPDSFEHLQLAGLYPCGEGAGYAGGIVSSALDGIQVVLKNFGKIRI